MESTTPITAQYVQERELEELLANEKLVVVDYTATWCGPCRLISPLIDHLATEYDGRATVVKIDIDQNKDNTKKYGIRSIPAVLMFKDGELVENLVGKLPYETFSNALETHLRL
ncbi:MAG: thioredoxin [Xenococcaceae cyanobacterium MO_207.B15]|nr:thioredoxin [Xenococcaceae cyanobacterium MO_207.B15]MDJ0746148.1 thioredoxin [Xenococcaceae cyanobacterium MO_167.B27]